MRIKPFVKWVGGKNQLLSQIDENLPKELKNGEIEKYIEPFIGGGALFFHIVQNYQVKEYFINDKNPELILVYKVIKKSVESLIKELNKIEEEYLRLNESDRKVYYYEVVREPYRKNRKEFEFNKPNPQWIERAAHTIFLNRTCYNGLFRVNRFGEFNVPYGRYKNPKIVDEENLRNISDVLKKTRIENGHFDIFTNEIDKNSFVYFDPPYRPISNTANFTSYTNTNFNHFDQVQLANYFNELDVIGAKLLLSNSEIPSELFEDRFYEDNYNYKEKKIIRARRSINSDPRKRGFTNEILLRNY